MDAVQLRKAQHMSRIKRTSFWVIENTVTVNCTPCYLQSSVADFETFYRWTSNIDRADHFGTQGEAETHATRLVLYGGWHATWQVILEE